MQNPSNEPLRPIPQNEMPGAKPGNSILRNPLAIALIALAGVLLAACVCLFLAGNALGGLFSPFTGGQQPPVVVNPGTNPQGNPPATNAAVIDQVIPARQLNSNNQATSQVTSFSTSDQIIYVTYHVRSVQAGTRLNARWIVNGQVLEDSDDIVPQQALSDRWGEFHLAPAQGQRFPTGNWEVQIRANGIQVATARFVVQ